MFQPVHYPTKYANICRTKEIRMIPYIDYLFWFCTQTVFNEVKNKIVEELIPKLVAANRNTNVGIATMAGTTLNVKSDRLAGYLKEIQPPVPVWSFIKHCFDIY